jgi:hypothetical protein
LIRDYGDVSSFECGLYQKELDMVRRKEMSFQDFNLGKVPIEEYIKTFERFLDFSNTLITDEDPKFIVKTIYNCIFATSWSE